MRLKIKNSAVLLIFSLLSCKTEGIYPTNINIEGLAANSVTAKVLNCYNSDEKLYILIDDGDSERLLSVTPWDPKIEYRMPNHIEVSTYGWHNGHSTVVRLYQKEKNSQKEVLSIGRNVRINAELSKGLKINMGGKKKKKDIWLYANILKEGALSIKDIEAGKPLDLEIETDKWKFILFGATFLESPIELSNPNLAFVASYVLYLPKTPKESSSY